MTRDDSEESAERVATAMVRHGMAMRREVIQEGARRLWRMCDWPPPPWAETDGYHEVEVVAAEGIPGSCEADGTGHAERIRSDCPKLELHYLFHGMGARERLAPLLIARGEVRTLNGNRYNGAFPYVLARNEMVVLRNGKASLVDVRCLGADAAPEVGRPRVDGFIERAHGDSRLGEQVEQAARGGQGVRGRNFSGAAVGGRNLEGSNLAGGNFTQADFRGAHLKGADLRGADLRRAVLRFCCLEDARLDGAKLAGAEIDVHTYQMSRWTPEELVKLHRCHSLQIVGLDTFPEAVRREFSLDATAGARGSNRSSVQALIAAGESAVVEFKSMARPGVEARPGDKPRVHAVVKAIAGFTNATGGTLLLGVKNDGTILGLDQDYATLGKPNRDGYELFLTQLVQTGLSGAAGRLVRVGFEAIDGKDVCRVDVAASPRPVFAKPAGGDDHSEFWVRLGNGTRQLVGTAMVEYQQDHWRREPR